MQKITQKFDSAETAIQDIASGKFVIVVDDADRENEGDLIIAAEKITTEQMAFLVRYSSGLVCVALDNKRAEQLRLPLMVQCNNESQRTAFTVSVDYRYGTSTGISAHDRALTLRTLANPSTQTHDFYRPGHVFPLIARPNGVLERPGHTEAAYDLAILAGLNPAGVLCEIVNDNGGMARRPDLFKFAQQYDMTIISIADLIRYREQTAPFHDLNFNELNSAQKPYQHLLDAAILYAG